MAEKEDKYFVLKLDDLAEYTTPEDRAMLNKIAHKVSAYRRVNGKEPNNRYIVCNQDEPYAEDVWRVILSGEDNKGGRTVKFRGAR